MPRSRSHDAELGGRLVEAASALIAERGADGFGLRELAAACGTSTSAVYGLFGGRSGLVGAVIDEAARRFGAHLAAVRPTDNPAADLAELGRAYRRSALEDPNFYRVMFSRAGHGSPNEDAFDVLVHAAQRCIDAGLIAAEARQVAHTLWALVHGLVSLELAGFGAHDEAGRMADFNAALGAVWFGIAVVRPH